jgi:hypothetical protein
LYLKGTSWLTSVWPLMMRLSAALTRFGAAANAGAMTGGVVTKDTVAPSSRVRNAGANSGKKGGGSVMRLLVEPRVSESCDVGLTSSSQDNINNSNQAIMGAVK